jgi:hypothetical protein
MKQLRAAMVAACLAMSLAIAVAGSASAAPKPTQPNGTESVCSAVATRTWGTANNTFGVSTQAGVQELKNSDSTSCFEYRGVLAWKTNTGFPSLTIDERFTELLYLPGNDYIGGSAASNFTHLNSTSSWQYYYGPWVSIPCNTYFHSAGAVNIITPGYTGYPVAYSYGLYASC